MAKILMIQIQHFPYVGTAYLNSAARSGGHKFILHGDCNLRGIANRIADEKPDIIGFSCVSSLYQEALAITRKLKERFAIPIIMGGSHPTLFPNVIAEPSIDIICRGEGEFALVELLNAIENKTPYTGIKNLWVKSGDKVYKNELRPLLEPLDSLPPIDWSCYDGTDVLKNSPPLVFLIWGCPYSCSYCFNEAMRNLYKGRGSYVRHFSVERSVLEIKTALAVFSRSPVVFTSDSFGFDLEWMAELFKKYSEITDLPFVLHLRPELATERCISILAKYNCYSLAIGVESGSERVRRNILNRNYSNRALLDVAERLHRHKIKFRTYNILGLPTETNEEMWETIDMNIRMKTDFPRGSIFTPMPDTKIVEIAKAKGYLDQDFSFNAVPKTVLSATILKNVDGNRINNTLFFFQTAIIFPGCRNFIRRLARLKSNILFRLWFYVVYIYLHRKSEGRELSPYIKHLLSNMRYTNFRS